MERKRQERDGYIDFCRTRRKTGFISQRKESFGTDCGSSKFLVKGRSAAQNFGTGTNEH